MGRVLTIVAAPPPDGKEYDENPAIQDVRRVLPAPSTDYAIEAAWSVEEVANVLERDRNERGAPALVQIVGHGQIGILFLGDTWTNGEQDSYGRLDSNGHTHNVLANKVDPDTLVWLLGCDVGVTDDVGNSGVADGPTLLFDLCRVWMCAVSAPVTMVMPLDDFADGIYKHTVRLVTAKGLSVRPPARARDAALKWNGVGAPRW